MIDKYCRFINNQYFLKKIDTSNNSLLLRKRNQAETGENKEQNGTRNQLKNQRSNTKQNYPQGAAYKIISIDFSTSTW
jgi:hypothetical protein